MKIPIMEKQGKYFITPESEPLLVTMLSETENMILLESNIIGTGDKNQVVLKNCVGMLVVQLVVIIILDIQLMLQKGEMAVKWDQTLC